MTFNFYAVFAVKSRSEIIEGDLVILRDYGAYARGYVLPFCLEYSGHGTMRWVSIIMPIPAKKRNSGIILAKEEIT